MILDRKKFCNKCLALIRKVEAQYMKKYRKKNAKSKVKDQNHKGDFKTLLLNDREAMKFLSPDELERCFELERYLRNVGNIYKRIL